MQITGVFNKPTELQNCHTKNSEKEQQSFFPIHIYKNDVWPVGLLCTTFALQKRDN
jgi:hypothetical protein